MLCCYVQSSLLSTVSDVQVTVSIYKQPYNLSVIVERSSIEWRFVLCCVCVSF